MSCDVKALVKNALRRYDADTNLVLADWALEHGMTELAKGLRGKKSEAHHALIQLASFYWRLRGEYFFGAWCYGPPKRRSVSYCADCDFPMTNCVCG